MKRILILLACAPPLAACRSSDAHPPRSTVDSVVPIDTALARFRQGLEPPAELEHGAGNLDDLIQTFVHRLEQRDTAGLAALALTRAEFAYLYYPTVPEARPPYELSPGLLWFMIAGNSARGLASALSERGGVPLGYLGHRCPGTRRQDGDNTVWTLCVVRRLQAPGDTVEERLFGPIVERHGRFKFVTFANKL
jgi:hypothetical protein